MRKITLMLIPLFLSGCFGGDDMGDLKAYVKTTLNKPRGRIEPIPVFKPYEFFNYSASGLRSPFELPQIEMEEVKIRIGEQITPDFERPKEHLEQFPVGQLAMVGTIEKGDGILWALVRDGEGGVVRVRAGNHMGQNYGEITDVSEYKIKLIEIILKFRKAKH